MYSSSLEREGERHREEVLMDRNIVLALRIAADANAPMRSLPAVHVVPGRGIEGDRYYLGVGSFPTGELPAYDVSLIEEDMYRELEREALSKGKGKALRRNIVVSGCALATLIEQPFQIGTVLFRGLVPRRLQHLSLERLTNMCLPSGIGAQALTEGDIHLGDEVYRIISPRHRRSVLRRTTEPFHPEARICWQSGRDEVRQTPHAGVMCVGYGSVLVRDG